MAVAINRLRKICLAMPETFEKVSHGEPTFWAGQRMFAMFADARNHHGYGRPAVWCKAVHETQTAVIAEWPDRCFVPPYVGVGGWFGIYLDKSPDWKQVAALLADSHRLAVASPKPRAKAAALGRRPGKAAP
jgi:predicted DNA-binding protein (MmcQ/YjbR family)